jgi:AAA domain
MATQTAVRPTNQYKPIPVARKAEKRQVKLRLGIQGPSGSGKTEGALGLATNLWPGAKILLIDTENESASLYADRYEFDTIPLDPPFETVRYEACIDYAVESGYDVLIMDSVTHQWDGEGGILRRKEELDRRPGSNSYTNWNAFTPEHTHFIETIKQAPIHIIATMRSKQGYVLEQDGKGKSKPVKMGMEPIQRDGFDYEFSLVFDVQMDHKATVCKNRTGLFEGKIIDLTSKKVADQLREWQNSGKAVDVAPVAPITTPPAPKPQPVAAPAATAKVEGWKLEGETLSCYVYDAQRRISKNKAEYVAVKHNGSVNGKDIAFCFHERLFAALLEAKNKHCVLFLGLGDYIGVEDVLEVEGVRYSEGAPDKQEPPPLATLPNDGPITDDDIPF